MKTSILSPLLLSALALPAVASPNDWYVDGNVAGPGTGTALDPFRRLQQATDASAPGDRILVAPAIYTDESLTFPHDLTVEGTGERELTRFEWPVQESIGNGEWNCPDGVSLTLRGLSLVGSFPFIGHSLPAVFVYPNASVSLEDVSLRGFMTGVEVLGHFTISSSLIEECGTPLLILPGPIPKVIWHGTQALEGRFAQSVSVQTTLFRNNYLWNGTYRSCAFLNNAVGKFLDSYSVENSLLIDNYYDSGGHGEFLNCTIVDDFGPPSTATVRNSILANAPHADNNPQMTYCLVPGGYPGVGNVDGLPRFRDPLGPDGLPGTGDEDYRLTSGSPAIDAGDNRLLPADLVTDLLGRPRRLDDPTQPDTGIGSGAVVDMGAFERRVYPSTPLPPPPPGRGVH